MDPVKARRQRAAYAVTLLLVSTYSVVACRSTRPPVANPPVAAPPAELRVGIATNYPPIAFKQGGEITGIEAQFAHKLGPELNMKVTLIETPFEELIPALLARRIDVIMSGMSITDERQKLISFVHPYLQVGQMMLLRRADAKRFKTAKAIDQPKTRIGAVSGTTGEAYARGHFVHAKVQGFDGVDAAVTALRNGQLDVFIHDAPSIWRVTTGVDGPERQLVGRYEPLTAEYLAWAVRKDDVLRNRLNAVLRKWNDDGELDALLKQWIRVKRPSKAAAHH